MPHFTPDTRLRAKAAMHTVKMNCAHVRSHPKWFPQYKRMTDLELRVQFLKAQRKNRHEMVLMLKILDAGFVSLKNELRAERRAS